MLLALVLYAMAIPIWYIYLLNTLHNYKGNKQVKDNLELHIFRILVSIMWIVAIPKYILPLRRVE